MAQVLTLVCEGETSARKRGFFPCREDAITASSRHGAEALAEAFRGMDRALSGPHTASRQTAEAMALGFTAEPLLSDLHYGLWAGRRVRDVAGREAESFAGWLEGAAPPEGEAIASLFGRVRHWLDGQCRHEGRTVAVVSPNVVRACILDTLGSTPQAFARLDIEPLCFSELTSDGRSWRVRRVGTTLRSKQ